MRTKIKYINKFLKVALVVLLIGANILASSPVFAADGSGTMIVSPTSTTAGSTGGTYTFTYTAAEAMDSGGITLTVPSGWSTPQGVAGTAGYTTVSTTGTVGNVLDNADSITGWNHSTVNPKACTGGLTIDTVTKHEGTGSIKCVNSSDGNHGVWYHNITAQNWSSYSTVGFWIRVNSAINNGDLTFEYAANNNVATPIEELSLGKAIPANAWTHVNFNFGATTRTSVTSFGFKIQNLSSMGSTTVWTDNFQIGGTSGFAPIFSGNTVTINSIALAAGQTITITYGSGGGTSGATAPTAAGLYTFTTQSRISDSGVLTNVATSPTVTVNPGPFAKLQLLVPGETASPGSASGKTGTPTAQTAGSSFNVTVNAVDANWNVVSSTNTVGITSSDANATLPANAALVAGTKTFAVSLNDAGTSTLTATDITDGTKTANTSPNITVNAGAFTKLQILVPGETANPGSATGKTGTPTAQTAGAAFSVIVNSVDANWNIVSNNNNVGITSTDGNAVLPANGALAGGTKSFNFTFKTSGVWTITATDITDGTKTPNTSPNITVNAGVFAKMQILVPGESADPGSTTGKTGAPNTEAAGVPFSVTVNAVDANWNVASSTHTVSVTSSDAAATLPPNAALVAGTKNFTVTLNTIGAKKVTATDVTDGTKTANTSPDITVVAGALDHFVFNAVANHTAGVAFNVTMTAVDAGGNTVTSFTGTVDLTADSGNISPTVSGAFVNGVRTESVTLFDAGTRTITATDHAGSGATGTSNSFTLSAGAINKLQILVPGETAAPGTTTGKTGTPTNQITGIAFTVTVNAVDANWNVVSSTDTVGITSSDGTATLPPNAALVGGTKNFSVTFNTAGNKTVTATDITNGARTANTSPGITVTAPPLDHFVISTVSSPQTAGTPFNITVTAKDINGNTVTGFTGTVDLTTNAGTISPTTSGAFVLGVRTESVTLTQSGTLKTITATKTGGTETGTSNTFTVNAGALDHFVVTNTSGTNIATQTAGSAFNIKIIAQDVNNNTVTSFVSTVALSNLLGGISPTTSSAFTAGVLASQSVTLVTSGTDSITATGSTKTGTSNSFTVNPGALDHFVFTAIPSQTAGTPFSVTITAVDVNGNTVAGFTGTVDLTTNAGSISPVQSGAFVGGVRTESVTLTQSGTLKTITATDHVGTGKTGTSNSFTVNPGALDHFAVTNTSGTSIGTQTSGVAFNIKIVAQDANNNTATNFTSTVTLSNLLGGISPTNSGSFVAGVLSSQSVTLTTSGTDSITATAAGKTGTSNTFTVNPGALDHFVFTNIGTQTAGTPFNVTITAVDVSGNTVTGFVGSVDLTTTAGSISPTQSGVFVSGVRTESVTLTQSGTGKTITATDHAGTGKNGTSNAFTVSAGALDHFVVTNTSGTNILTQAAGTPFNIKIVAQDLNNNTVTSFTSTVALSNLLGGISPTTSGAFTAGILASQSVTLVNTGTDSITATGTGKTGTSNSFTVNPGALDHFSFAAISTQTAGTAFNVTITAQDANNNTVTGFTGTVDLTSNAGSISPTLSGSFVGGVRTQSVTLTPGGTSITITATDHAGTGKTGTSNTFTLNNPVPTTTSISPTSKTAGSSTFTLTVNGTDFVSTSVVSFDGSARTTTFVSSTQLTASIPSSDLTTVGTFNITVTNPAPGGGISNAQTFTVSPGALDHFAFSTISSPQTAGTPFSVTITAQDAGNNTVTSFTGKVDFTTNAGSISPTLSGSFVAGVLTESVSVTQAGTLKTVTATDHAGTGKTGTSNTFTVNPGALDHFVFSNISTQAAGAPFNATITAVDVNGNTVTGFNGTVDLTTNAGSISPTQSGAFVGGVRTESVTLTQSGALKTITATDHAGSGATGTSNTFTVNPGTVDHFVFGNVADQDENAAFNITMTAKDANGNTVTGFSGTVDLTTSATSITPTTSGSFVSGVRTQSVTLVGSGAAITITAVRTGGSETGTSNSFVLTQANNPAPVTTSISPTSKTVGDAQFTMTVTGSNFITSSVVRFNGSARTTTYISPTQLTAIIPASDLTTAGTFSITVFTGTPGGGTSNVQTFTVNNPAPTTTSISPTSKTAGDATFNLTVNGTNFVSTSVVNFAGSARTTSFVSSTQLTASIPSSDLVAAGAFSITVTNPGPGGGTSNAETLTVNASASKFVIIDPTDAQVGTNSVVTVQAQDSGNNVATSYSGSVTLHASGSASGDGVVTITNGAGAITITDNVAETVHLSLTDSASTGFDISSTQDVVFFPGANASYVLNDPGNMTVGTRLAYTVTRKDNFGNPVTTGTSTVYLYSNSTSGTKAFYNDATAGIQITSINITPGSSIANFWYYDDTVGTWTIKASDNATTPDGATGINDGTDDVTVSIIPVTATKFVIVDPTDGSAGSVVQVTVKAVDNSGALDTTYNNSVTLNTTGSALGGGVATITNGIGTMNITDNTAETVNLSLTDSNNTGLDVSSTQDLVFSGGGVAKFVLNDPGNMTAGTRLGYTITREDQFNNPVTTGSDTVFLYSTSTGGSKAFFDAATNGTAITSITISGSATANFWYFDNATGTWTITASDNATAPDGATGLADGTDDVTISNAPIVATKFVILPVSDTQVGTTATVTVKAEDNSGNVDTNSTHDVTLNASGSATGAGVVHVVNGVGTIDLTDSVAETVTLTLTDSASTGLNVSSTQSFAFTSAPPPPPPPPPAPAVAPQAQVSSVEFSGHAAPGGKVEVVGYSLKNASQGISLAQDAATADGSFLLRFPGSTLALYHFDFYILNFTDVDGVVGQSKLLINNPVASVFSNIAFGPTVSLLRSSVRQGDFLSIKGYTLPFSLVQFELDGTATLSQSATAGRDGSYSLLLATAGIPFGKHSVRAKAVLSNGLESDFSLTKSFTVSDILIPLVADFNDDGAIDIRDVNIFLSDWLSSNPAINLRDDLNGDGIVNIQDLSIFAQALRK